MDYFAQIIDIRRRKNRSSRKMSPNRDELTKGQVYASFANAARCMSISR